MTTAIGATNSQTPAASPLGKLASDMTMFLKLLTTQMQNQDPLDPMDTSEYTQQLVQFSQVEQSIQQNKTLTDILDRISGQDLISASSLVGKSATFDSPLAGMRDGEPARWTYDAATAPAQMVATITDSAGNEVATIPLDQRDGAIAWDGARTDGGSAPAGVYTLSISASDSNGRAIPVTIKANAMIDEATIDGDEVVLRGNGASYSFAALSGTSEE